MHGLYISFDKMALFVIWASAGKGNMLKFKKSNILCWGPLIQF